jgi:chromosome partitioning protein
MSAASQILSTRPRYETILQRSIQNNNLAHDFVIIDCPPAVAALTTTSLTAADLAIIPTQCEYFAIQAVSTIFSYIRQVRAQYNPQLSYKLLVTMFDLRGKLHTLLYEKLESYYANALFKTVIGFDSKLRAAQIVGQPITVFAPRTRAARQYRDLSKEIEAYVQE